MKQAPLMSDSTIPSSETSLRFCWTPSKRRPMNGGMLPTHETHWKVGYIPGYSKLRDTFDFKQSIAGQAANLHA
jgi:hypothetical protein